MKPESLVEETLRVLDTKPTSPDDVWDAFDQRWREVGLVRNGKLTAEQIARIQTVGILMNMSRKVFELLNKEPNRDELRSKLTQYFRKYISEHGLGTIPPSSANPPQT